MHQKCTAMTAMYMYFATLYNVYCECQIFVCCINQQKCNIHIFINARKKDKFGSVLQDVFAIHETFQDEFRG